MRLITLPVILLAGCATLADVDIARDSWNGARFDDVVLRWGPPNLSATLNDGRQVSTWVTEGVFGGFPGMISIFGGSGGGGIGATIGLPGMGGGELQRCERTLTFRDDRVTEQSWLGHRALCSSFKKE